MSDYETIVDDRLDNERHRLFIQPRDSYYRSQPHHPHDLRYESFCKDELGNTVITAKNLHSTYSSFQDAKDGLARLSDRIKNNMGY